MVVNLVCVSLEVYGKTGPASAEWPAWFITMVEMKYKCVMDEPLALIYPDAAILMICSLWPVLDTELDVKSLAWFSIIQNEHELWQWCLNILNRCGWYQQFILQLVIRKCIFMNTNLIVYNHASTGFTDGMRRNIYMDWFNSTCFCFVTKIEMKCE